MGYFSEQLHTRLDSQECQAFYEKYMSHRVHVELINNKYIEKFHSLQKEEKAKLLYKIKGKYESKEYQLRFDPYNGPDYSLYHLLEDYARKYCKRVPLYFGENDGNLVKYDILGKFILEVYDSLFSVDYQLYEVRYNTIIPHEYPRQQYVVSRYGNDLFSTDSEETLTDVIAQVFEKKLEGYTYRVDTLEYSINVDGTVSILTE